jgi:hypothetical protein
VVAEDGNGSDFQAVMIRRDDFAVFPILQMTGPQHGTPAPPPFDAVPTTSEVSGLAFNPAGDRLYFNSQRGLGLGITYEVAGPWLEALQQSPSTATTTAPPVRTAAPATPSTPGGTATLPVTGGSSLTQLALGAAAGAGALTALRRRLDQRLPDAE